MPTQKPAHVCLYQLYSYWPKLGRSQDYYQSVLHGNKLQNHEETQKKRFCKLVRSQSEMTTSSMILTI